MVRLSKGIALALACVALLLAGSALAQQSTTITEKKSFEIISVDGNHVVFKGEQGVREVTLPPDFKISVEGKEIGVADLKPGMKGTALVTTKVTSTPVVVTEVRNAEVLAVQMTSIIVRGANGVRKFTTQDVSDKNISIMRNGERVELSQLRPGDRLTATIITKKPPVVTTEREIHAAAVHPAPAPAKAAAAPEPAPAPAAEPVKTAEAAPPAKKLPKTGTDLPLAAGLGVLSLAVGVGLTLRRVRKAS